MGIDSGYATQMVYAFARRHDQRVMAMKGKAEATALLSIPHKVDVNLRGRRVAAGGKLWIVGVSLAKEEFYGFLRLDVPTEPGARFPAGFCHFPDYDVEIFKQLTSEQLVTVQKKSGHTEHHWEVLRGRQNHALDARNYARGAMAPSTLERMLQEIDPPARPRDRPQSPRGEAPRIEPTAQHSRPPRRESWLGGGRPGGWLGKR